MYKEYYKILIMGMLKLANSNKSRSHWPMTNIEHVKPMKCIFEIFFSEIDIRSF